MHSPSSASYSYEQFGLVGNPFTLSQDRSADSVGTRVMIRSASFRLLAQVRSAVAQSEHRPILVAKAEQIPQYFAVAALAATLADLSAEGDDAVLSAYVPLDMMRIGRVRAVHNVFAERVANTAPERTIGAWMRAALATPDESLTEWAMLLDSGFDAAATLAAYDADPEGLAVRIFGAPVETREGAEDLETLMRVSTSRRDRLANDPEGDEVLVGQEEASDDPLAEAFTTSLAEPGELPAAEDEARFDTMLAEYTIAHLRAHLSPVVARGVKAYRAQGCASMAEELKVSKAPTKTLAALLRFARGQFKAGVVIYDRLEMWESVPEELRDNIVESMTRLRENLREDAVIVCLVVPGAAPEVEAAFEGASSVEWGFDELQEVRAVDAPFNRELAMHWIASAALDGRAPQWAGSLVDEIPGDATLAQCCEALGAAIEEAKQVGQQPAAEAIRRAFSAT